MSASVTIAGLGPGAPGYLTMDAWELLKSSGCTFLRTGRHPVVNWLVQKGVSFSTFDYLYEQLPSFDAVYAEICRVVLAAARQSPVLYAVPGHPLVYEESVRLIMEEAQRQGVNVCLQPALSFLDVVPAALNLSVDAALQVIDGLRIDENLPSSAAPAIITQVHSRLVASDVKISLLEYYPPEHVITVVRGAGIPGEERIWQIPLWELDRLDWLDHLTSLYIPKVQGNWLPVSGDCAGEQDEDLTSHLSGKGACRFSLDPLAGLLVRLRGEGGCPWDREQDHLTLRPYLLEETYEVLEALNEENMDKLCEELGDLLLQIVFHAQIASENRFFNLNDVVGGISEKMIRRHPHVFGAVTVKNSDEVHLNWEKIKEEEKNRQPTAHLLDDVPRTLPALMRAVKLQKKAAGVGFDWPDYRGAMEKCYEELTELKEALASGDKKEVEKEMGDLFFSLVNLARLINVEPETALAAASKKFVKRFAYVEDKVHTAGKELSKCTLAELDAWWDEAKKNEIEKS